MELKRRQESQQQQQQQALASIDLQQDQQQVNPTAAIVKLPPMGKVLASKSSQKSSLINQEMGERQPTQRRVRGRRSSKPMMEKRRRARINQCLDILKSYVLTDSTNLSQLGIDASTRENHDEETIARTILKSSGLINRHRGRKNPNKLEKADILELTVDYVRSLHQRLINNNNIQLPNIQQQQQQPSISCPLTLDLSPIEQAKKANYRSTKPTGSPPSPPPSSASSSPQPLLSISSNLQHYQLAQIIQQTNDNNNNNNYADILDLSDCRRKTSERDLIQNSAPIYKDNMVFIEGTDGCWRPTWDSAVAVGLK